jgi:hypothetical protein
MFAQLVVPETAIGVLTHDPLASVPKIQLVSPSGSLNFIWNSLDDPARDDVTKMSEYVGGEISGPI